LEAQVTQKRTRTKARKHKIVSRKAWIEARKELLAKEKAFTRQRDKLSRLRRELPWEKVDKPYVFEGPQGKRTVSELFDGKSQLVVYHFMFAPDWNEGCPHCSFWADNFDGIVVHLKHRDVAFVAISRAPVAKLEAFRKRMGWRFPWFSSGNTDFNFDYDVSFRPEKLAKGPAPYNYGTQATEMSDREGVSVFCKDADGSVFHTYSSYSRGIDMLNTAYHYLDLAPKGRDEDGLDFTQSWVRYHDRYED
jgi:predicted dithiol-disulfide oxidoreductase (DUF899 family)